MTYVPSSEEIDERLDAEFNKVVTPEFQAKLDKMAHKAAEEYGYELQAQLSFMLEDGQLAEHIRTAARQMAGNFIEAVQRGDDECVEQFFGSPNVAFLNPRQNIHAPHEEPKYGGIALRRKLIEAVQDRLENERIKDMQAEIDALRKEYLRAKNELQEWRTGERNIGESA